MTQLKFIEEMCAILHDMACVIEGQQKVIMQHDATAMVEEYEATKGRYTALLGQDEWPDGSQLEED